MSQLLPSFQKDYHCAARNKFLVKPGARSPRLADASVVLTFVGRYFEEDITRALLEDTPHTRQPLASHAPLGRLCRGVENPPRRSRVCATEEPVEGSGACLQFLGCRLKRRHSSPVRCLHVIYIHLTVLRSGLIPANLPEEYERQIQVSFSSVVCGAAAQAAATQTGDTSCVSLLDSTAPLFLLPG